jgi:NADPH-dependent curcumin reductase CurA
MSVMNRQVLLASRPQGPVTEGNFRIVDAPLGEPGPGEVLVRNEWLSLDPYMRGRMNDVKSYVPPVRIGEVMVGQTVGEVVASRDARFVSGDKVLTPSGWQLWGIVKGDEVRKIDVGLAPASCYLGLLGMPGMTAWFGLFDIGAPRPGETVVVSAASGAVGGVVGQLAKIHGCRAVGIAGGAAKCDYVVRELGFDACVDHRRGDLSGDLRAACPNGADVHFENVGGAVLDTMLGLMNPFSRVVICGLIAEYNATAPYCYTRLRSVLVNRIRMQGMIVFDWKDRYGEALRGLSGHLAAGRLRYRESVVEGIDNAPRGLIGLLRGENFGKQLVRLA